MKFSVFATAFAALALSACQTLSNPSSDVTANKTNDYGPELATETELALELSDVRMANSSAINGLTCDTISRSSCFEVCLVRPRRPITLRGYAVGNPPHGRANWTEVTMTVYDRQTRRLVDSDTEKEERGWVENFIDVPAGDYRVVTRQENYRTQSCGPTYATVHR